MAEVYDFSFYDDVLITDRVGAALQEIDMIFNTSLTEVLGCTDYGSAFESFLWEICPETDRLKSYIIEKISQTYYASQFPYTVSVKLTSDMIAQTEASGGDTSIYEDETTYVVSIDLYGNDATNAGSSASTKVIMF